MGSEENRNTRRLIALRRQLDEVEERLDAAEKALQPVGWWNKNVEPDKPRWTYILPTMATFLGSLIAFSGVLWTLYVSHEKIRLDRAEDNYRFAVQQAEDQFEAAQTRLASPDEKTRAAAALQLADLAVQAYPVRDPKSPTGYDQKHYFFPRVASQFAIALTIEEKEPVRDAIERGFRLMLRSVKGAETDDAVLREVIADLADANQTAKDNYIYALAAYNILPEGGAAKADQAATVTELGLDFVASLSPFCDDTAETKRTLTALMQERAPGSKETKFAVWQRVRHTRRLAMTETTRRERYVTFLDDLEEAGYMLMDTRDSLALALRALAPPPAPPAATPAIDLTHRFLAGADLHDANLRGVDLTDAYLEDAKLPANRPVAQGSGQRKE